MTGSGQLSVALTKRQGDFTLEVAFDAPLSGAMGLVGPSGSGKSTLFACLAGLASPDSGRIEIDGEVMLDTAKGVDMRPARRRIGVVFQDGLLFPHMSVRRNLVYGAPRGREGSAGQGLSGGDPDRFDAVVSALGLGPLLRRRPPSLSGGERQRVAIGRALLARPRLLLLDEPLSSLDPERKFEVLTLLEGARDQFGTPMIYISHAPEEIRRIADRVLTMRAGRLLDAETAPARSAKTDVGRVVALEPRGEAA